METCVNISCANNKYTTSKGTNRGAAARSAAAPLLGGAERPPFAGGVFIVGAWNVDACFHFATENLADVDMILEKNWGSAPKLINNLHI